MELKQIKTIIDVRKNFLMKILGGSAVAVLAAGILCNYLLVLYSIPVFTIVVFGIFTIVLSIFYDIYINSTYRIFLNDEEVYIYYPTYSSRAGNEFIYYKVEDVTFSTLKGSSIVFDGHVLVKTEGIERDNVADIKDVKSFFNDIFAKETYIIQKRFRISRIFENEEKLMELLNAKG